MTNTEAVATRGRYTVGSLQKALRLIDLIASGPSEGMTVSELARALGASKSATFSLARTLLGFNYLRVSEPGTRYQLGLALVRLGDISASGLPLASICQPVLHDLNARARRRAGGDPLPRTPRRPRTAPREQCWQGDPRGPHRS